MVELDWCPGYKMNHYGDYGVCCCGLHWEEEMPPHDSEGRVYSEGTLERKRRQAEKKLKLWVVSEALKIPKSKSEPNYRYLISPFRR